MPLPAFPVPRELAHTRSARFEVYKRADGLWDIEARLTDVKPRDFPLSSGVRTAGEPVHDMWIRLTVDQVLNVVEAIALTEAMPYAGHCERINPDYKNLVGLNLARGFRQAVQARFGAVAGCTHLNELLAQFPTAAIQAMAGERRANRNDSEKPFQLDRCHALDTRGAAVARFYPRWFRPGKTGTNGD